MKSNFISKLKVESPTLERYQTWIKFVKFWGGIWKDNKKQIKLCA